MKKQYSRIMAMILAMMLMLAVFSSCNQQGEQGPAGAQGPAGEQGEQGPVGEPGKAGDNGNGIKSISKTSSEGVVDTYTVTYTDGTTTTFTVTNGENGIQGIQGIPGNDGHSPIITIQNGYWYIDGVNTNESVGEGVKGDPGNGISDIRKTKTVGLVDTYTITYTNGDTSTFTVTNGAKGETGATGAKGATGATGAQGPKGDDGLTPYIKDGYWYIGNTNTNVKAEGTTSGSSLSAADMGYVVITDYVTPNTGADVSSAIQKVIDDNPNRTIYFPDGEYILAKPIMTSGSSESSVSLHLSNYAVLKASDTWTSSEAMVRIGGYTQGKENDNNFDLNNINVGSNYYFYGGVIDGSSRANGISIDSGREISIRNVSIKYTKIGIHIKKGSNNGSSDADLDSINISCDKSPESIGIKIVGYDNTLTNIRISRASIGVQLIGAGNFLRNVHPLFVGDDKQYQGTIGFDDQSNGNWYDFCYSDGMETGFAMVEKTLSTYQNCYVYWYNSLSTQIGFKSTDKFNSIISDCRVDFNGSGTGTTRAYIKVATSGGSGRISCPIFNTSINNSDDYKAYMLSNDKVMWK